LSELRRFRTKQLALLLELKKELILKYPGRRERIEYIVDLLAMKLHNLRIYTLSDYVFTLYLASKEFAEFERLIDTEEIEKLLESEDEE